MGKGHGITFTLFAALGAIAGYATYMANKDEFSEDTKDRYDTVLNKVRNVGTDIKRTYTSIGDKTAFKNNANNLSENAKKLAIKAGDLVKSASSDMFANVKDKITNAVSNFKDDEYDDSEDTISKKKVQKKKITKKNTKKK